MVRTYAYRCARMGKGKRAKLEALLDHLAWVRNDAVAHCRKRYAEDGSTPSVFDLDKRLTNMRKENTHTASMPVLAQRSMLRRVRAGYDRMFKHGAGRPRFRPEINSFELCTSKPRGAGKGWTVQIKSVGKIRFNGSIPDGEVRNVRIVRHPLGTGYDVQLVMQLPDSTAVDNRDAVGIDLGVKAPCSLSNGTQYAPVKISDREKKKRQRAVVRAKRRSRSRAKKKQALSKESHRVAIKRRNAVHRMTSDIVKNHSANLVTEELQVQSMTAKGGRRKRGLNRSMREQSLGLIVQQLAYKAESAGGKLVTVSPHNTTQQCSSCGGLPVKSIGLGVRTYRCDHCGLVLDRDVNAARNIRLKGLEHFSRPGLLPAHRSDAAVPRQTAPLALEHSLGVKHGYDAGSYAGA